MLGSYEQLPYIYASFLRFARRRIGRLRRLRAGLAAPDEIAALLDETSPASTGHGLSDIAAAWSALEALPKRQRGLLTADLSDDGRAERQLAADFKLTRYELRLRLADAVGRAAVTLIGAADFTEGDRAIALALWRDNRTPKETAALLHISAARIDEARHRVFARLVAASRSTPSQRFRQMKKIMKESPHARKPSVSDLLVSALRHGTTDREIAALADHRDEILNWLDEHVDDLPLDVQPASVQLAKVYTALGGTMPDGIVDPLRSSRDEDDAAVGVAFADVLLPNLPEHLQELGAWFSFDTRADEDDVAELLGEPSVVTGGGSARHLAEWGITPVTVAVAGQALSALAARVADAAGIDVRGKLVWEFADSETPPEPGVVRLERARCIREVELATELPDGVAASLHDWLGNVAAYAPLLLDGFDATLSDENRIALTRTECIISDLGQRWRGPDDYGRPVAVLKTA